MKYYITKHIEGMDKPFFRINYESLYHTGSWPISDYDDAVSFIAHEFGTERLPYALGCLKTEISEMVFNACKEMEKNKYWKTYIK